MREITERKERTTQPLCIYNDIHTLSLTLMVTHIFLQKKIRVTSCEITKLSLTRVFEFHELQNFEAGPLFRCASSSHHFALLLRVLLHLDASECSFGVIPNCYFRARLRHCPYQVLGSKNRLDPLRIRPDPLKAKLYL